MNTRGHKSLHIAYQRRTWQLLPFVLSLLGFISSGAPGFSSPATNLCQNARPALVTLFSVDPRFQWPSYQGSGFLISDGLFDQGQVASAWNLMAIINAKRNNTQGVREALDNLKRLDPSEASNCVRELRRDFPRLNLPLQEPQP